MKFIFRTLETRDGEREYQHKSVHRLEDDVDPDEFLAEYLRDFWGDNAVVDDMGNHWFFGEIITKIYDWKYINEETYNVLKNYV